MCGKTLFLCILTIKIVYYYHTKNVVKRTFKKTEKLRPPTLKIEQKKNVCGKTTKTCVLRPYLLCVSTVDPVLTYLRDVKYRFDYSDTNIFVP